METDVHKLYTDLNQLLDDICKFLSSDKVASFSHKDKKLAEALINRSKVQLQKISKLQKPPANDEYVDMDGKKVLVTVETEGKHNIYSSVDDINSNVETTVVDDGLSYHKDLPAKDALRNVKYGEIMMKRKFLIGFEKMKKIYATIHHQWLVIYVSEKDMKPICTFDLKDFTAKKADNERNSNFELIGALSNKKIYYFLASTHKDMLQWVVHINRCHDRVVLFGKEIDFKEQNGDDSDEVYCSIMQSSPDKQDDIEEEDDIYFELDTSARQNNNTITKDIPKKDSDPRPPLPGRRPMMRNLIPIPPPVIKPTSSDSEESIASYEAPDNLQHIITKPHNASVEESASEEDEDPIYEEFVDVRVKVDSIKNNPPEILTENTNSVNCTQIDTDTEANIDDESEYQNTSQTELKSSVPASPKVYSESDCFDKAIKEAISRIKTKNYSPTKTESKFNISSQESSTQEVNFPIPIKSKFTNKPSITIKPLSTFRQRNNS